MKDLPPVVEVLPHGPQAILLTRLISCDGDRLVAMAMIPAHSPYARTACAGAALIEAAAQASAAHGALRTAEHSEPGPARRGWLVGIKNGRLAAHPPLDVELRVGVQRTGGAGPLAIYAARVSDGDHELLRSELSVWTAPSETVT